VKFVVVVSWSIAWTGLLYGFIGRAVAKRNFPRFDPRPHRGISPWRKGAAKSQQWRQDWIVRTGPHFMRIGCVALGLAIVATTIAIVS
jgi:hypothetical protein